MPACSAPWRSRRALLTLQLLEHFRRRSRSSGRARATCDSSAWRSPSPRGHLPMGLAEADVHVRRLRIGFDVQLQDLDRLRGALCSAGAAGSRARSAHPRRRRGCRSPAASAAGTPRRSRRGPSPRSYTLKRVRESDPSLMSTSRTKKRSVALGGITFPAAALFAVSKLRRDDQERPRRRFRGARCPRPSPRSPRCGRAETRSGPSGRRAVELGAVGQRARVVDEHRLAGLRPAALSARRDDVGEPDAVVMPSCGGFGAGLTARGTGLAAGLGGVGLGLVCAGLVFVISPRGAPPPSLSSFFF